LRRGKHEELTEALVRELYKVAGLEMPIEAVQAPKTFKKTSRKPYKRR
jgi:hypothetical protein